MWDRRDRIEIQGLPVHEPDAAERRKANSPRPWLGIMFRCCHAYGRIYKTPAGDRYEGFCPRCGARVKALVGPGGTTRRLFEAK